METGEIVAFIIAVIVASVVFIIERLSPETRTPTGVDTMGLVAECPKCHVEGEHIFKKSWNMKNTRMNCTIRIEVYRCKACDQVWRRGVREDR